MSDERTLSRLVVVGASHQTSSEATRDRLFIAEQDIPRFLSGVRETGFSDVVVMSTCARTEIFGIASDHIAARAGAVYSLAQLGGFDEAEIRRQTYFYQAEDALRHLIRVSAALDSPIIGEPMVTGQFREAVRIADVAGFLNAELITLIQEVNRTSKRIRTETVVGQQPVSMAACAVQVARDVHGDFGGVRSILVTGGEMGELIADQLCDSGLSHMTVVARRRARAEITARRYNCHFRDLDDLSGLLAEADIVVTSLGGGRYLFDTQNVSSALAARRRRPMLFLDAAIPSDVDPAVNDVDGAFVYSLDDLEGIVLEGRFEREKAAAEAESIIDAEIHDYQRTVAERDAVPAILALREHFERIRRDVLADNDGVMAVDEVTRRLINRLLHDPSETLRKLVAEKPDDVLDAERLIIELYGLTDKGDKSKE
ncbi:MAG: glutamyl-tRNA reductase [Pseudomonadota bacterium]|nr:glutamyl-tRNA reductase [Pseudomonadota bacterium]